MKKTKKILLFGATGFLGQYLLWGLLNQGHQVIAIIRCHDYQSLTERLEDLKNNNLAVNSQFHVQEHQYQEQLTLLSGDLCDDQFGLTDLEYTSLLNEDIQSIWNVSALLKYEFKFFKDVMRTNVESLPSLLKLCVHYKDCQYVHISSAFILGNAQKNIKLVQEDFYLNPNTSDYNNCYCLSKRMAENLIYDHHLAHGTKYLVLRPSIIVGDSKTGFTSSNTGLYEFLRAAYVLQKFQPGAHVNMYCASDAHLNLIPVDLCAHYCLEIAQKTTFLHSTNKICNIIDPKPETFKEIILMHNDFFDIKITPKPVRELNTSQLNKIDKKFLKMTRMNHTFTRFEHRFSSQNSVYLFGKSLFIDWHKKPEDFQRLWHGFHHFLTDQRKHKLQKKRQRCCSNPLATSTHSFNPNKTRSRIGLVVS